MPSRVCRAILLLLLPCLAAAPAAADIEGSWVLVEQHYGDGQRNLADPDSPVRLELRRVDGRLQTRITAGGGPEAAQPWPAFLTDAGPLPVQILESGAAAAGELMARYRVRPSAKDDLVLEIREHYRLSGDGASLVGTMEVVFAGGTTNRGSFVLHRRFERSP
jgi:hypothetical protein